MFWTNVTIDLLLFCFIITCLLMCLVILMQRSKQDGLSAAIGANITSDVWGAQTPRVLVQATVWLGIAFFFISISLARLYSYRAGLDHGPSALEKRLEEPAAAPMAPLIVHPVPSAASKPNPLAPASTAPAPAPAPASAGANGHSAAQPGSGAATKER